MSDNHRQFFPGAAQALDHYLDELLAEGAREDKVNLLVTRLAGLKLAWPVDEVDGVFPRLDTQAVSLADGRGEGATARASASGRCMWLAGEALPLRDVSDLVFDRPPDGAEPGQAAIVLRRRRLALVLDSIEEEISLPASAIVWRSDDTRRPWLAGTCARHQFALVDVSALLSLIPPGS